MRLEDDHQLTRVGAVHATINDSIALLPQMRRDGDTILTSASDNIMHQTACNHDATWQLATYGNMQHANATAT